MNKTLTTNDKKYCLKQLYIQQYVNRDGECTEADCEQTVPFSNK